MGEYDKLFWKYLLEQELKGKLKKVKSAEEARSASENKKIRDTNATNLFSQLTGEYRKKIVTNKILKIILFCASMLILVAFVVSFIICLFVVINLNKDVSTILSILVPAGLSITTSIISIIMVIAKYLFPQDEDKYFAELLKVLDKDY